MPTLNFSTQKLPQTFDQSSFADLSSPENAFQTMQPHYTTDSPPGARYDFTQRLPAELWTEIFDMCSPPGEDGFDGLSDTTTPEQEVERLAKKYLLRLSQVCIQVP